MRLRFKTAEAIIYGITQIFIILLAVANVLYPQYLTHTILLFAVFLIAVTLTSYTSIRRRARRLPKLIELAFDDVRRGRKLIEVRPEEVIKLVSKDYELRQEMRGVVRRSTINSLSIFIAFTWYFIYFRLILPNFAVDELLIKFMLYITGYEVPYVAMILMNRINESIFKTLTYVLQGYEIYDKGIVSQKQGIVIRFPLDSGYSIKIYPKRRCVELTKHSEEYVLRYLLYCKDFTKVGDILNSFKAS